MVRNELVHGFLVAIANIHSPKAAAVPEDSSRFLRRQRVALLHKLLQPLVTVHRGAPILLLLIEHLRGKVRTLIVVGTQDIIVLWIVYGQLFRRFFEHDGL